MRGGVARVRVDRELERGFRLVEIALRGVEHREVVVGLGELGIVLGEPGEHLDRVGHALLLGEDEALEEAPLRIARLRFQECLDLVERRLQLALAVEFLRFAQVVGGRRPREHGDGSERGRVEARERETTQEAVQHRAIIC